MRKSSQKWAGGEEEEEEEKFFSLKHHWHIFAKRKNVEEEETLCRHARNKDFAKSEFFFSKAISFTMLSMWLFFHVCAQSNERRCVASHLPLFDGAI